MYRYEGERYFAIVDKGMLSIGLMGEVFFRLKPVSRVHADGGKDEEISLSGPVITENGRGVDVVWTAESTVWSKKEYIFRLTPEMAFYSVRVCGSGKLDRIEYFMGDSRERFSGSGYDAADYMAPLGLANAKSPNRIFTMAEDTKLGIEGFTPAPPAFSFRMADVDARLLLGIAALPGKANFDGLEYRKIGAAPDISRFCLSAEFGGYQPVDGEWESPAILMIPAENNLSALNAYAAWHYAQGLPRAKTDDIPAWWKGPFFCGWKEQAVVPGVNDPQDAATQSCYRQMSDTLDERGLRPSAIIIDDKWQGEYGAAMPDPAKWPDMRAWIEDQHDKGRRVVLWFKCWDAEGLTADECILRESGEILSADPTSPAYRARVHTIMHTLLSSDEGCMNADGFKIDFADRLPFERNMRIREKGVYGFGLLHSMMELLHDEAKKVKPDALINTSCCHPLFAALTDQARLHDTYFAQRDSVNIMKERADIFRAMIPELPVDMDAGSCGSRRDFMRYARASVRLGVPDIYILNPIEDCALTAEDWDEIRRLWEDYRRENGLD